MTQSNNLLRVVVCGTKFGRVYLAAFDPPAPGFELVGIVAHGSARSHACAAHYGVPLFNTVDEVPADVDIACVVVGAAINGGRGAELAQAFMARGIHVLQEHPLHLTELAACLQAAHRHRVVYRLNTHYLHVPPVQRFIRVARALFARQRPLFIDAACSFQVAYTLLDVLAVALGGVHPFSFAQLPQLRAAPKLDVPFRSLDGFIAGVPITLRVQNQMDPADPDNHAHLFHRISFGTEGGNLTLTNTYGPIVWSPRPYMPTDMRETVTIDLSAAPHFEYASATIIGPAEAPSYREILRRLWPDGVRNALIELRAAINAKEDPRRRGQLHVSLCELWQDLVARLGPVELVKRAAPEVLPLAAILELLGAS